LNSSPSTHKPTKKRQSKVKPTEGLGNKGFAQGEGSVFSWKKPCAKKLTGKSPPFILIRKQIRGRGGKRNRPAKKERGYAVGIFSSENAKNEKKTKTRPTEFVRKNKGGLGKCSSNPVERRASGERQLSTRGVDNEPEVHRPRESPGKRGVRGGGNRSDEG